MALPAGVIELAEFRGPQGPAGTFKSITVEDIPSTAASSAVISGLFGEHLLLRMRGGMPGVNAIPAMSAMSTYISAVGEEVDRTLRARYPFSTTPEKYIAEGKDSTTAVEMALAERSAFGKMEVRLDNVYPITRELRMDAAQTVLTGRGGVLQSQINDASKWLLTIYSTDPGDIASPIRQAALGMTGVILWGDEKTNGLNISGASFSDKPAHIGFERVVITRFGTAVRFGQNAYMIRFHKSNITLSRIGLYYDGAANAGERLSFVDCDITGHGTAIISIGQAMHFLSCSFSYNLRRIARLSGGAQVYMEACHIEMSAPYTEWFNLTGNGTTVNVTDTRWLMRDQTATNVVSTFTNGSVDVAWPDNPRDRFGVGDPFRFSALTGPTNIDTSTTYYFTQVSSTGYRFAASAGGTEIVPNAAGSAAGILPVQGAAMINVSVATCMFSIRGGHMSGSVATGQPARIQTISKGPGGFLIDGTSTFDQATLYFRNRENGDLFDGMFNLSAIVDDFECDAIGTLEVVGNELVFTKTGGGAGDVRLWFPVEQAASFLMEFRHRASVSVTVAHSAFWRARRGILAARTALYTSPLASTTGGGVDYSQTGFAARHAPAGARYVLFTWTMTNLAVGDKFVLSAVRPSAS